MKNVFILLFLVISIHASAQWPVRGRPPLPNNYTSVQQDYWHRSLAPTFFTLPAGCGAPPAFPSYAFQGAGAIYLDSCSNTNYYYSGGAWRSYATTVNTLYNANDSVTSNRIVYVNGVSFPTRTLTFSQNSSTNNTTNQTISVILSTNRFMISKTNQVPGTIPDNFAPFLSVGRLSGSGTVNYAGDPDRYRPLVANFVGGFTNSTTAAFANGDSRGPTTLVNSDWQTDRTAAQTITGWIGNYRSSLQFTGLTYRLTMGSFVDFIAGGTQYGGIGTLAARYQYYARPAKIDSVASSYAFYNEGTADSNYFAGPVRIPNLPDSDSTNAKPVGRLANGVLVDLPYWPGSGGGGGGITNLVPTVASVTTATTITEPTDNREKTYIANATSGAIAFTAAVSPTNGQIINIFKSDATANAVTITTVEGAQSITTQNAGWRLQYITALSGYKIISSY